MCDCLKREHGLEMCTEQRALPKNRQRNGIRWNRAHIYKVKKQKQGQKRRITTLQRALTQSACQGKLNCHHDQLASDGSKLRVHTGFTLYPDTGAAVLGHIPAGGIASGNDVHVPQRLGTPVQTGEFLQDTQLQLLLFSLLLFKLPVKKNTIF